MNPFNEFYVLVEDGQHHWYCHLCKARSGISWTPGNSIHAIKRGYQLHLEIEHDLKQPQETSQMLNFKVAANAVPLAILDENDMEKRYNELLECWQAGHQIYDVRNYKRWLIEDRCEKAKFLVQRVGDESSIVVMSWPNSTNSACTRTTKALDNMLKLVESLEQERDELGAHADSLNARVNKFQSRIERLVSERDELSMELRDARNRINGLIARWQRFSGVYVDPDQAEPSITVEAPANDQERSEYTRAYINPDTGNLIVESGMTPLVMTAPGIYTDPDQMESRLAPSFRDELKNLLNKHSKDARTNTPDFILANTIAGFIETLAEAAEETSAWRTND